MISLPILQGLATQYSDIVGSLGIESVAIYLLLFVFISVLHMCFEAAVIVGGRTPPSIDGKKLQLVERRFSKDVVAKLLASQENPDVIARFTSACQKCVDSIDPAILNSAEVSDKFFSAVKAYLLFFILCLYIFPSTVLFVDIADNRGAILLFLIVLTGIAAFVRLDSLRTRYLEFIDELEDCVEKHVRPTVAAETYAELTQMCAQFRKSFRARSDWNLPIVGSLREVVTWLRVGA